MAAGWIWTVGGVATIAVGAAGALIASRRVKANKQHPEPWVLRRALVILLLGAAGAVAAFVVTYRATDGADKDRFDVAIKAATASAALAAGVLTWGRLELSRHEHRLGVDRDLTERYGRAVEQLGSGEELVRVGGVFALERFALDAIRANDSSDVDWRMALGLLAALARQDSALARTASQAEQGADGDPVPVVGPTSALEAVQALGRFVRRSGSDGRLTHRLNLTGVVVPRSDLGGADLAESNLTDASLTGANLIRANLTSANLTGANLTDSYLIGANLTGADLTGADLTNANLTGADLTGAILTGTNLTNANLSGADLTRAFLTAANLTRANLTEVDLISAFLAYANLTRANLSCANLTGARVYNADLADASLIFADLAGADFTGTSLTGAHFTGARGNDETRWPAGFIPPNAT